MVLPKYNNATKDGQNPGKKPEKLQKPDLTVLPDLSWSWVDIFYCLRSSIDWQSVFDVMWWGAHTGGKLKLSVINQKNQWKTMFMQHLI